MEAVELIRKRVKWCESEGVAILCCPEAILGVWQTTLHNRPSSRLMWNGANWALCSRRLQAAQ